jgi:hypothetical protein
MRAISALPADARVRVRARCHTLPVRADSLGSLSGLISRMRCQAKKRWMRGARRSEYRESSQAEQQSRRAFWQWVPK